MSRPTDAAAVSTAGGGGGVLMLWIDVDPALVRETDAWYVDEHLPDRIHGGGYTRARRFDAVDGAPRYLTMFDATTPEALASDGYLRLVGAISDQSKRIRAGFSHVVRNTFEVRAAASRASGGLLAAWRLARRTGAPAASGAGSIAARLPGLVAGPVVAARWLEARPDIRATMDRQRVTGLDDAAVDAVLVVEAGSADDIATLRAGPLADAVWTAAGFDVEAFGIYRLMVDFSAGPGGMP